MVIFFAPLLFSFVAVINTAAAASLGDKTDPVGSGCVVTDSFICKGVGAPDGCPLEMTTTGVTEDQTKAILEKHNQVRRKVAKGEYEFANQLNAANMKKLVWNEKLASSAQKKVNDQCSFGDRFDLPGADASFKRSWLLSDPANATMEMEDLENIIQYWFDLIIIGGGDQSDPPFNQSQTDISRVDMTGWDGTGDKPASSIAGSALGWAGTESLGCGLVIYSKENWRMLEMLCFYDSSTLRPTSGPGYEVGPACSSCQFWWPAGFSCDDGLCASSNPLSTTTESGSTESGSTESGSTESGSTESGSTEGESTESGSTESGSTESGSTESGSTAGESTDSSTLELEVGKLVGQLVEKLISLIKN